MKKTYEIPFAEMHVFCKDDVMNASVENGTLTYEENGLGDVLNFENW